MTLLRERKAIRHESFRAPIASSWISGFRASSLSSFSLLVSLFILAFAGVCY